MKTIKLMIAAVLIAATFSVTAQNAIRPATKAKATSTATVKLKDHVCNSKCTAVGHYYLHGEKGHVCTAACKKSATRKA